MEKTQQPTATADRTDLADRARIALREPFRAATWRRSAYVLLAGPVGIVCLPLALVGGPAARIECGLARRLLGMEIEARKRNWLLTLTHNVISAPVNCAAVVVSFYFWLIVVMNLGYPLRPDNNYADAWGGPTLGGAWALHALAGGVPFLFITPWVVRGFTALQTRLLRGFVGTDRSGLVRTITIALGVAAVCTVLSVPVIHQL